MISFLNPAFAWTLPVAAGPVVLHWLTRPKTRRIAFSSVELLREAVRSRIAFSRLKQVLLLAARCALIAALCLVFARPVLHWSGGIVSEDGTVSVLLLDASYSMSARAAGLTAFDRARDQVRAFLESAGEKDRVGLVVYSNRVESSLPPTDDLEKVREAVDGAASSSRPSSASGALEAAYRMLRGERGRQKAVVVFSDLAANGWRGRPSIGTSSDFDPAVHLVLAEMGPAPANAEVVGVSLTPGLPDRLEGAFRVRAYGSAAAREWRLFVDGESLARGRLPEGADVRVPFSFPVREIRSGQAELRLDPDALESDDHFFFSAARPEGFSALFINGAPALSAAKDEAYFLKPVLDGMAARGFRYKIVTESEAAGEDFANWSVVALLNERAPSAALVSRLQAHLKSGGGLWLTAGEGVDPKGPLSDLAPGRFTAAAAGGAARAVPANDHPLARAWGDETELEWNAIDVQRLVGFEPTPGASVLLQADDRPLLCVGPVLGGRSAVLTTTIDRDWTNLPSKPAFPILCQSLLTFLAGRTGAQAGRGLVVDEPFQDAVEKASSARIARPDQTGESVPVTAGRLSYLRTDRPGFYRVSGGGAESFFWVNLDHESGEGDLALAKDADVKAVCPARDVVRIPFPEPAAEKFSERVRGRDLTALFGLLALVLFALQAALERSWRTESA